ncbi:MAG: PilZ domain-containing protein [Rhizobiales bacterium]|nr:PilZ domain-containing protein [Hyphomicrobiales bacterium]
MTTMTTNTTHMTTADDNARTAPRTRTFLKGVVLYDNRRVSIECTIRDLSDTGARIAFPSPITIPDRIELFIPQKNRTYSADVRRRDDCEVGIAFRDQRSGEQRREADATMGDRIAALEHEVAQLRRIVKQLRDKVLPHETDV